MCHQRAMGNQEIGSHWIQSASVTVVVHRDNMMS
jgi:hypothetical protein